MLSKYSSESAGVVKVPLPSPTATVVEKLLRMTISNQVCFGKELLNTRCALCLSGDYGC